MKPWTQSLRPPLMLKCFLLSVPIILLLLHHRHSYHLPPPSSDVSFPGELKIRPGYTTYDSYIQRQLNKTLNPKLRRVWTTRDWDRKIHVFAKFFDALKMEGLLRNDSKALCIGARVGQEVEALKRVGVADPVGMDLVPHPPLVVAGDFHRQPFGDETFDFEFSNVFDHALYPDKFVGEIERTLRPGGVCVLHVAISRRGDKYSANDLFSVEPLVKLFKRSEVIHVGRSTASDWTLRLSTEKSTQIDEFCKKRQRFGFR